MAAQGTWLPAQVRYAWLPYYYLITLLCATGVLTAIYALLARVGLAMATALDAGLLLVFVAAMYIFLKPFQSEVTFERGHAFCRATGVRATRPNYVKPSRAIRTGLTVDVRNKIRGFRIPFRNDQDASLFIGWCRDSGVPISQPVR